MEKKWFGAQNLFLFSIFFLLSYGALEDLRPDSAGFLLKRRGKKGRREKLKNNLFLRWLL